MAPAKNRRWIPVTLIGIAGVLLGLISVDQFQGGPLGREFQSDAFGEGINTGVGRHILFGGSGELENPTWFPFDILSVRPVQNFTGATLTAGIIKIKHGQPLPGVVYANQNLYPLARGHIFIPPGENIHSSGDSYDMALIVIPHHPGSFEVDGLFVRYRWGPFVYTAKFPATFTITAKSK